MRVCFCQAGGDPRSQSVMTGRTVLAAYGGKFDTTMLGERERESFVSIHPLILLPTLEFVAVRPPARPFRREKERARAFLHETALLVPLSLSSPNGL